MDLLDWFKSHGGTVSEHIAIHDFPLAEGGRGMVATRDLDEGHELFNIPRTLLLSQRTSELPKLFGEREWRRFKLHKGWNGLILCMMWEEAAGLASKWAGYFENMSSEFSTLMFWSETELQELQASYATGKIGREDAERTYREHLFPAIQARPDLFPPAQAVHYSLERFHIMGSRILSRSFTVEDVEVDEDAASEHGSHAHEHSDDDTVPTLVPAPAATAPSDSGDVSMEDARPAAVPADDEKDDEEDEGEESEDEAERATTMVPIADMLNARTGSNNARLFHETQSLRMVAIAPIPAGAQIWNTYGDCANQELLRRYGYVDVIPLNDDNDDGTGEILGNPADIAEVKADVVVKCAVAQGKIRLEDTEERIDWWLEAGGDDVFYVERACEMPEDLVAFAALMLLAPPEWEKARVKNKPPRRRPDQPLLELVVAVLRSRLSEYPTSIEEDEALLATLDTTTDWRRRNAIVVRLGEKRILAGTVRKGDEFLKMMASVSSARPEKRKANDAQAGVRGKKQKR